MWLLAFTGFFLLHAAWAFAAPYNGPADEQAHTLRAAAVFHGDLISSPDGKQEGPASLRRDHCFEMNVTVPADCALEPGGDDDLAPRIAAAGEYNPVYYAVLAWPAGVWPDYTGIIAARLLTGAAMAAFLASAVAAAVRGTRHRGLLTGLVVALTPTTAALGGALNPSGLEITAGVGLFAALIPLLLDGARRVDRATVALAAVSAGVLVTLRPLGLLWLGLIVVTVLIGASRHQVGALLRRRGVRIWAAVLAVVTVAGVGWNLVARPLGVSSGDLGLSFRDVVRTAVVDIWPNVANQMVGGTSWNEILQPRLVYLVWFMAAGLLVLGALALGHRADRWRTAFLFLGTFAPLLGWEMLTANDSGWFNQGRYFLPTAVGLPMLGAHVLAHRGLTAAHMRSMTRMLAALLLPVQLVVLAYTMCRWQSGLEFLNPLRGSWLPVLGPVLPLALAVLAVAVLFGTYWTAARVPDEDPSAERVEPAGDGARTGSTALLAPSR